jgi:hypothetical protein
MGKGPPAAEGLGLMPKVRLPLPRDCGPRFAEYVEAFTEIQGDDAGYLKLWAGYGRNRTETTFLNSLPG